MPDLEIEITAVYVDHGSWPSPIGIADATDWGSIYGTDIAGIAIDNNDGSYAGQITVYRAGAFRIDVKVNSLHINGSPYSPLLVEPTNIYAPYCVPGVDAGGIPESMIAGTEYDFLIQGRDFYQNNIQDKKSTAFGTDFLIQYSLRQTESDVDFQPVLVKANLEDDSVTSQADGVYRATFTLEKAGEYDL